MSRAACYKGETDSRLQQVGATNIDAMPICPRHPSYEHSHARWHWVWVASMLGVLTLHPASAIATPVERDVGQHSPSLPNAPTHDSTNASDSVSQQITGIVRNYDTDAPIENARISAIGIADSTVTGRDGRYTITLTVGSHPLRFTYPGYQPLTIVALVGDGSHPIVDVSLTPLPARLPDVQVHTTRSNHIHTDSFPDVGSGRYVDADGGQVWSQAAIRSAPQLDQSDLFRLLGTVPMAAAQNESPSSLHFGGGAADQNLVLLDGIPIENAVHAGWLTSAVDPAAIETMTLYADHTPARFGGRLSSVVDLQTRGTTDGRDTKQTTDTTHTPLAYAPALSGTVGSSDIAVLAAGSNAATGASGLISLRHSPSELTHFWPRSTEPEFLQHTGWFDGLARGGVPVSSGELSAVAFQSHDAVELDAATLPFTINTGFEWISSAFGGTWEGALKGLDQSVLTLHAWQSNTETNGAWSVSSGNLTLLANALRQGGISADVHTTHEHLEMHSGLTSERFRTSYVATPYTASQQNIISTDPMNQLALTGTLATTSAYTDVRWRLSDRVTLLPGARVTYRSQPDRNGWQFEPRLGVSLSPGSRIQLAAYYSRTSQQLQSLRNEENVFDGIVGLNWLSVQNDRIPMATSTTFSGTLTAALSQTTSLTLGAYGRSLKGIVVAPRTGDAPFVYDSLTNGIGSAQGWYATLTRTTHRLMLEGNIRWMSTRDSATHVYYQPEFASTTFASFALGWHIDRWTDIHTFLVASGGRSAALTTQTFSSGGRNAALAPQFSTASSNDFSHTGTPSQADGSAATVDPGSQRLPPYVNLNVGMSRTLSLARFGVHEGADIRVFGAVDNVLNRANTIGISGDPGQTFESSTFIWYRPRTYTAGLDWRW